MPNVFALIKKYGFLGVVSRIPRYILVDLGFQEKWIKCFWPQGVIYASPDECELHLIENNIRKIGVTVENYYVDRQKFQEFKEKFLFPDDYHGGKNSGVWEEKMLEHFVAYELVGIEEFNQSQLYLDVAACASPWVGLLRDKGVMAVAIDMEGCREKSIKNIYIQCDGTKIPLVNKSVRGLSLQCAFEMFCGESDVDFIYEVSRVLEDGGVAVISPLYMHTHYCCYASAEYYGKGNAPDGAVEYVRPGIRGIVSSRKYDYIALYERLLKNVESQNMTYRLLAIRNKEEVHAGIYCHFVLMIFK